MHFYLIFIRYLSIFKIFIIIQFLCACSSKEQTGIKNFIFETDMQADCDDSGALAILHALADAGEAEIVAVMINSSSPYSAACVDAINTFFGRPDIPIGDLKVPYYSIGMTIDRYPPVLAKTYPNDMLSETNNPDSKAPDATKLYRRLLSKQPDTLVTIVSVGFLSNLARLIESKPDKFSPLGGVELINKKVKRLVVMAQLFGKDGCNVKYDIPSAQKVVKRWPTPIIWSPLGRDIITGPRLASECQEDHIIRKAFEIHNDNPYNKGDLHRRSSDQVAVLYAIRGVGAFFEEVKRGSITISDDGFIDWTAEPDKQQGYIKQISPPDMIAKVIEDMMVRPGKNRSKHPYGD